MSESEVPKPTLEEEGADLGKIGRVLTGVGIAGGVIGLLCLVYVFVGAIGIVAVPMGIPIVIFSFCILITGILSCICVPFKIIHLPLTCFFCIFEVGFRGVSCIICIVLVFVGTVFMIIGAILIVTIVGAPPGLILLVGGFFLSFVIGFIVFGVFFFWFFGSLISFVHHGNGVIFHLTNVFASICPPLFLCVIVVVFCFIIVIVLFPINLVGVPVAFFIGVIGIAVGTGLLVSGVVLIRTNKKADPKPKADLESDENVQAMGLIDHEGGIADAPVADEVVVPVQSPIEPPQVTEEPPQDPQETIEASVVKEELVQPQKQEFVEENAKWDV